MRPRIIYCSSALDASVIKIFVKTETLMTELTLYLLSGHVPVVSFIFLHWYFVALRDTLSYSALFA